MTRTTDIKNYSPGFTATRVDGKPYWPGHYSRKENRYFTTRSPGGGAGAMLECCYSLGQATALYTSRPRIPPYPDHAKARRRAWLQGFDAAHEQGWVARQ